MNNEPEIDIEIDDDLQGIAVIACPNCHKSSRHLLDSLSDGSVVECTCGFVIKFEGHGFSDAQRDFNAIKRTLDDFDKF